jgi:regulator of sirC expression with transglutaminase-like and TPR domain
VLALQRNHVLASQIQALVQEMQAMDFQVSARSPTPHSLNIYNERFQGELSRDRPTVEELLQPDNWERATEHFERRFEAMAEDGRDGQSRGHEYQMLANAAINAGDYSLAYDYLKLIDPTDLVFSTIAGPEGDPRSTLAFAAFQTGRHPESRQLLTSLWLEDLASEDREGRSWVALSRLLCIELKMKTSHEKLRGLACLLYLESWFCGEDNESQAADAQLAKTIFNRVANFGTRVRLLLLKAGIYMKRLLGRLDWERTRQQFLGIHREVEIRMWKRSIE